MITAKTTQKGFREFNGRTKMSKAALNRVNRTMRPTDAQQKERDAIRDQNNSITLWD